MLGCSSHKEEKSEIDLAFSIYQASSEGATFSPTGFVSAKCMTLLWLLSPILCVFGCCSQLLLCLLLLALNLQTILYLISVFLISGPPRPAAVFGIQWLLNKHLLNVIGWMRYCP